MAGAVVRAAIRASALAVATGMAPAAARLSPEQIAGYLGSSGALAISHETIYRHIWRDLRQGGELHRYLRCAMKKRRKRYGTYERRGRLAGKRMIEERPPEAQQRQHTGTGRSIPCSARAHATAS